MIVEDNFFFPWFFKWHLPIFLTTENKDGKHILNRLESEITTEPEPGRELKLYIRTPTF